MLNSAQYASIVDADPPDTQVAAGVNDVVEMVNDQVIVDSKVSGSARLTSDLEPFFKSPLNQGISDPKVVYNRFTGHFYASAVTFTVDANGKPDYSQSSVLLAVSKTADPAGSWNQYVVNTATGLVLDQPKLGMSGDKIVLTANEYSCPTCYQGTQTYVVDQYSAEAGAQPPIISGFDDGMNKVLPVVNVDTGTTGNDAYEVYPHSCGVLGLSTCITVITITGSVTPLVNRSYSSDVGITDFSQPPGAAQAGTTVLLDTGDTRLQSASFHNGTLWTVANDACQAGGATLSCIRAIELTSAASTSPAKALDTDVYYPGTFLMDPAITLTAHDDLFIAASASSPSISPTAFALSAPAGSTSVTVTNLGSGQGPLTGHLDSNGHQRFGDYSGIGLDAASPDAVWVAAELGNVKPSDPNVQYWWGTAVAALSYR
jgi:hypothetical protein